MPVRMRGTRRSGAPSPALPCSPAPARATTAARRSGRALPLLSGAPSPPACAPADVPVPCYLHMSVILLGVAGLGAAHIVYGQGEWPAHAAESAATWPVTFGLLVAVGAAGVDRDGVGIVWAVKKSHMMAVAGRSLSVSGQVWLPPSTR